MNEAPDSVRTRNILQITPETVTLVEKFWNVAGSH